MARPWRAQIACGMISPTITLKAVLTMKPITPLVRSEIKIGIAVYTWRCGERRVTRSSIKFQNKNNTSRAIANNKEVSNFKTKTI
jgi:hypothetical protein